jgi:hypothetical protein
MKHILAILILFMLTGCSVDAPPVGNQINSRTTPTPPPTHELNLTVGERFQVVCVGGRMVYGDNGQDGIAGYCEAD